MQQATMYQFRTILQLIINNTHHCIRICWLRSNESSHEATESQEEPRSVKRLLEDSKKTPSEYSIKKVKVRTTMNDDRVDSGDDALKVKTLKNMTLELFLARTN
jgi:CRISPR/Cas system-associated exonuclease Cas4 (RecB family)